MGLATPADWSIEQGICNYYLHVMLENYLCMELTFTNPCTKLS